MKRGESGHAMIELAVSVMVMFACLSGTVEFGHLFFVYNQLVSAVGNAGRYAAKRTYRASTPQDVEKGAAAIRNMVVYGDSRPAVGATPVVAGLKPEQVNVRWNLDSKGVPEAVDISIRDFTVDALFKKFTFDQRPAVEFPFVGKFAPSEHEP